MADDLSKGRSIMFMDHLLNAQYAFQISHQSPNAQLDQVMQNILRAVC